MKPNNHAAKGSLPLASLEQIYKNFLHYFHLNKNSMPNFPHAFSLIEIMVGLIVISFIVAAFAPVITKKVSTGATVLSSVLGLGIESKTFLYDENKDNMEGCKLSDNKAYLECPFKVPQTINSINLVMSGAGGGGAGAATEIINETSTTSFTINDNVKNVKIPYIISAGGNGGAGMIGTLGSTLEKVKPTSQYDCDKIAPDLYYTGLSSCITKKNLSDKDLDASLRTNIRSVNTNSLPSTDYGQNICWSVNISRIGFKDLIRYNNDTHTISQIYAKTALNTMPTYPVCTYPAANYICSNYGYNTELSGKWRLPTSFEAKYLADNHPNATFAFNHNSDSTSGIQAYKCNPGKSHDSIQARQYRYIDTKCSDPYTTIGMQELLYDVFKNPCLPEYVWLQDGNYYLLKSSPSLYSYVKSDADTDYDCRVYTLLAKFDSSSECNAIYNEKEWRSNRCKNGALLFIEKEYSPFSVRCVIDDMGETWTKFNSYVYKGGGGASGSAIVDVEIPNSLLSGWKGAKIIVVNGTKGSGPEAKGGSSSVQIKKDGVLKFELGVDGGSGGKSAGVKNSTYTNGIGGGNIYYYYYRTADTYPIRSTPIYSKQKVTLSNGITFTFIPGKDGEDGYLGGTGGLSPAPENIKAGGGGQGGSSSDSYLQGQNGYTIVNYQNIYKGAAGGGGSGSGLLRLENIPVEGGKTIILRVAKGGHGGEFNTSGANAGATSFEYDGNTITINGGQGGKIGSHATKSNPNYTPIHGAGGSSVNYTVPTAYKSLITLEKKGLSGSKGSASATFASGGKGGSSGINEWSLANSISANELSFGCGGMLTFADYACDNSSLNAIYSKTDFSAPGKIYKNNNTDYGSSGSGGGGGGINYSTGETGKGSNGQNGYVMLWWQEEKD